MAGLELAGPMLDALRADHLGVYGYDRDTSPFLDELARQLALPASAEGVQ